MHNRYLCLRSSVLLSRNEFQFIFQLVNPKAQFIKGTMTSLNAAYDVTVAWSVLDYIWSPNYTNKRKTNKTGKHYPNLCNYSNEQYHPQEGGDLVKLVELSKTTKPVSDTHM